MHEGVCAHACHVYLHIDTDSSPKRAPEDCGGGAGAVLRVNEASVVLRGGSSASAMSISFHVDLLVFRAPCYCQRELHVGGSGPN